jgi:hypothetical protein
MNIFATACYKITKNRYGEYEHDEYRQLTDICIESFNKRLLDIDRVELLGGTVDSYHMMNKNIYQKLKALNKEGHNILYVDSDTICRYPTELFGSTNVFTMYDIRNNFCSFPKCVDPELYQGLKPWFMSNVRYYPANMKQRIWDIGDSIYNRWVDVWAYECIIYNAMIHESSKGENIEDYYQPEYNCQWVDGQTDFELMKYSSIIHVQATRGIKEAIIKADIILRGETDISWNVI